MFKKIVYFATSLFALGQEGEGVVAFLDKEQRPGAEVVTESFVEFGERKGAIDVKGVLGAIRSDRRPGTYVAFSGVEVGREFLTVEDSGDHFSFDLSEAAGIETLSVQIVLKNRDIYAVDLKLENQKEFKIPFSSFKESFRGRIGEKVFEGSLDLIKSVKFFLKRSENHSSSKEPIDFQFSLVNLKITK